MSSINSKQIKTATRYARALATFDERENILNELEQVKNVFDKSSDLKEFLSNPIISVADKKDVIGQVFGGSNEKILNFLNMLVEKNRFAFFDTILEEYKIILDNLNNLVRAEIISAVELNENEKNALIEKLQNKFKANIRLEYKIDKEIIAGLVIKIGDKVIDNSLKSKFKRLEKQLI